MAASRSHAAAATGAGDANYAAAAVGLRASAGGVGQTTTPAAAGIVVAVAGTAFGCGIVARPGCLDSIRQTPFWFRVGA